MYWLTAWSSSAFSSLLGVAATGPVAASAALPPYEGVMSFPAIQALSDAEDYSWEVNLGEEQELVSIDDQHAAVYYTGTEHTAFSIGPVAARDAVGSSVPTSLAVSGGNVITLTIHHHDGNPTAGGCTVHIPDYGGSGLGRWFCDVRKPVAARSRPAKHGRAGPQRTLSGPEAQGQNVEGVEEGAQGSRLQARQSDEAQGGHREDRQGRQAGSHAGHRFGSRSNRPGDAGRVSRSAGRLQPVEKILSGVVGEAVEMLHRAADLTFVGEPEQT